MTPNGDVIQSNVFLIILLLFFFLGGGGIRSVQKKNKWLHWIAGDILHQKQAFVLQI